MERIRWWNSGSCSSLTEPLGFVEIQFYTCNLYYIALLEADRYTHHKKQVINVGFIILCLFFCHILFIYVKICEGTFCGNRLYLKKHITAVPVGGGWHQFLTPFSDDCLYHHCPATILSQKRL